MKVAIFVSELNVRGGTHKQILRLSQYLNENGVNVAIFTPTYIKSQTYEEFNELEIIFYHDGDNKERGKILKTIHDLYVQYWLFKKSMHFDVVNVHDNRGIFYILLHRLIAKIPLAWQINDIDPSFHQGTAKDYRGRLDFIRRIFARLAAKLVNKITVNVTKNAVLVKQFLERDAEVLYCGVDAPPLPIKRKSLDASINIVSTGVFLKYRNYETLITACEKIKEGNVRNISLTIIGKTTLDKIYYQNIQDSAKKSKIAVRILGEVSEKELNDIYEEGHIFAFINIDQSWGLAAFEAAGYGMPVILSSSVGGSELLNKCDGVVIVDPLDISAIAKGFNELTKSDELYAFYSRSAVSFVKNLTWEKAYCNPMLKIFTGLAKS